MENLLRVIFRVMGRLLLVLGRVAAVLAWLVCVVRVLGSLSPLFGQPKAAKDAAEVTLVYNVCGFIINAALFVAFGRIIETGPRSRVPTGTAGSANRW